MDKLPCNWENLYYYNPFERKVFAILKQISWCPPKSYNFISNDTTAKHDSSSARSPAPSHEAWFKKATSVSCTTENRGVALSPDIFASKDFPRISVDVHHRSSKHNTSNNVWRSNLSAKSSSVHYDDDSDYSDDLYGTGRPLRPSLINSDHRVQEWQLSAQGNPEVTVFLEDTFQPDSHEEMSVSNRDLTAFLENEFKASVTSKCAELPPSIDQVDKNPSVFDDLAVLIMVDEPMETSVVVDAEEISVENDTIIEDTLILPGMDSGITEEMEYQSAELDYRCLSDDGTEIDSEFDKIEYEFQPVHPLSMEEMKILCKEMEKTCTENEPLEVVSSEATVNAGDVEENLNIDSPSDTTLVEVVSKGNKIMESESADRKLQTEMMEEIFESPNSPPAADVEEVGKQGSQQSTPIRENDKNDVCSSYESQPPSRQDVSSEEIASIELPPPPPADTIQDSSKSTSFARIIVARPSDRIKTQADRERSNQKEDLVDFLLGSGLFSVG